MDQLAELRERRALTLRELAEMSGVAADTINQIELGHRKPRPSTLRKLARALGVDVEELMPPKTGAPSTPGQPEKERSTSLEDVKTLLTTRLGSAWLTLPDEEWDKWWLGIPREEVVNRFKQIEAEWQLLKYEWAAMARGAPSVLRREDLLEALSKMWARIIEARYSVPREDEGYKEFHRRRLEGKKFRTFYEAIQPMQQETDKREKRTGA